MSAVQWFRLENLNIDTKWSIIPVNFNDFTLVSGNLRVCLSFKLPHQLVYVLHGTGESYSGKSFTGKTKEYDKFTVSKILNDWSKGEIYVHFDLKL